MVSFRTKRDNEIAATTIVHHSALLGTISVATFSFP